MDEDATTQYEVVSTDAVAFVVSDVVDEVTTGQTQELETAIGEGNKALSTQIELVGYEQGQRMDSLPQDVATATADELERRESAKAQSSEGQTREAYTNVMLVDEQWQYVVGSLQYQSTCLVLSLVLNCALLGAMVTGYLLDRWRT